MNTDDTVIGYALGYNEGYEIGKQEGGGGEVVGINGGGIFGLTDKPSSPQKKLVLEYPSSNTVYGKRAFYIPINEFISFMCSIASGTVFTIEEYNRDGHNGILLKAPNFYLYFYYSIYKDSNGNKFMDTLYSGTKWGRTIDSIFSQTGWGTGSGFGSFTSLSEDRNTAYLTFYVRNYGQNSLYVGSAPDKSDFWQLVSYGDVFNIAVLTINNPSPMCWVGDTATTIRNSDGIQISNYYKIAETFPEDIVSILPNVKILGQSCPVYIPSIVFENDILEENHEQFLRCMPSAYLFPEIPFGLINLKTNEVIYVMRVATATAASNALNVLAIISEPETFEN